MSFNEIANSGMEPTEDLAVLLGDMLAKVPGRHILLYGPPGTGKTTLAGMIAARMGKGRRLPPGISNFESLQCHSELTDSQLVYQFLPNEQGGAIMIDGVAKTAWTHGTVLVLDEISHIADAPAMSTMFKILDDRKLAKIRLPDSTYMVPKEGFTVIATMNDMPEVLPEPIRDRFAVKLCMWRPTTQAVETLECEALRNLVVRVYRDDPDNAFPTFRDLTNFEQLCHAANTGPTFKNKQRNMVAQLVWGPQWREACTAIDQAETASSSTSDEGDSDSDEEETDSGK